MAWHEVREAGSSGIMIGDGDPRLMTTQCYSVTPHTIINQACCVLADLHAVQSSSVKEGTA